MEALIKARALDYLVQHRAQTLRAPYTVQGDVTAAHMGKRLGVPLHDLIHVLWDLQKRDYVRFRERKRGGGDRKDIGRGDLDRFQVTGSGFAFWKDTQQASAVAVLAAENPAQVPDVVASIEAQRIAAELETAKPKTNGHANGVDVGALMRNIRGEPEPEPAIALSPVPVLPPPLVALLARYRARQSVKEAAKALELAGLEDQAIALLEMSGQENDLEDAMAEHLMGCPHAREP